MPDDALDEQQDLTNVITEAPIGFVSASERPSTIPHQRERTRLFIAVALTVLFAGMITIFLIRILFFPGALSDATLDTFKTILAIVAGIYGTIIGFYFGSQT